MESEIEKFKEWLKLNYPEGFDDLNPPITKEEVEELQSTLGFSIPNELLELLKIHNGQKGNAGWLFDGQEFLSSSRIIDEWKVWKGLLDGGNFDGFCSEPEKGIKDDWWNDKWVPFTYNGCGDHFCIDADPDVGGNFGQVITMWHDAGERERLAPSLADWLKSYVDGLQTGVYVYSEEYDSIVKESDI